MPWPGDASHVAGQGLHGRSHAIYGAGAPVGLCGAGGLRSGSGWPLRSNSELNWKMRWMNLLLSFSSWMSRHSRSTSARSSAVIGLSNTTIHICISVANHQAPKCAIWRRVQSRIVGCALDLDHTHIPSPRPNRPRSHAIDSLVCSKRSSKFARLTRWKRSRHRGRGRLLPKVCPGVPGGIVKPTKFRLNALTTTTL